MTDLSTISLDTLPFIESHVEDLVEQNINIKKFFFDSVMSGNTPEKIGTFFENTLIDKERKNQGQYYTPEPIVEYMLSQLDINKDSKILDPACGCGSFLLTTLDIFRERYGDDFLNNIYGIDLDEQSVHLTRACLFMKTRFKIMGRKTILRNIKVGNTLTSNPLLSSKAFIWQKEFKDIFLNDGFDFVIGNPPYVMLKRYSDFDPDESIYSSVIDGPVNAASLMIIRALEVLKPAGVLAFLLPKSILFVESYKKLRRYLLRHTHVMQIFDLGSRFKDVRGEQIILIVKKAMMQSSKHKITIRVFNKQETQLAAQSSIVVSQNSFNRLDKFLTFDNERYYDLVAKIKKTGRCLSDFVDGKIFRGLSVGGNRIDKKINGNASRKIIRGKNIKKFGINDPGYISEEVLDMQSPAKIKSLSCKKIVLQNIYSSEAGVIAAFDRQGILSLDTVTNIAVDSDEQADYILALLNSKLVNFYLMYAMFGRSKLTMHLDKSYIGQVPVVEGIEDRILNGIRYVVSSIVAYSDVNDQKQKNRELDKLIYDIYELKEDEINIIEDAMSQVLSTKSKW